MTDYFVVLSYLSKNKVEYWCRLSVFDICDCIQEFMLEETADDVLDFTISIHQFDEKDSISIDDDLKLHLIKKNDKFDDIIQIYAKKIDQKYDGKYLQQLPDEIYVCEMCHIFTVGNICKNCESETQNIYI